jgi:hypothetical protein
VERGDQRRVDRVDDGWDGGEERDT